MALPESSKMSGAPPAYLRHQFKQVLLYQLVFERILVYQLVAQYWLGFQV